MKKAAKIYSVNADDYNKFIRIYDRVAKKYDKEQIFI